AQGRALRPPSLRGCGGAHDRAQAEGADGHRRPRDRARLRRADRGWTAYRSGEESKSHRGLPGFPACRCLSCISHPSRMPKADFVCAPQLRVRWAEVDMQKIVFNGHYLTYIDTAIAEYWRAIGLPYPEGYVERYGNDVYLRKATVEYLGSARYDELLTILSRVSRLGGSSMTFSFE